MAVNSKETSQYYSTDIKNWYLDLWRPREVPSSPYDKIISIPPEFDKRPDLMSNYEYGTPRLWWVFTIRNPDILIDPIEDFRAGVEIYVPANIMKQ